MRILLINPPGLRPYIRDYYCSKVSKTGYLFEPVDLLLLSGLLAPYHELRVIDAIADRILPGKMFTMIDSWQPDVIISLVGSVSMEEDFPFLAQLADKKRKILVTGDIFRDEPARWLETHPFIDAIITDFTSADVHEFLVGNRHGTGIISRHDNCSITPTQQNQIFTLLPRHDLFTSANYRFPFVRNRRFATVLTDYGCPFPCTFCVMATLYYRFRPVQDVIRELNELQKMGTREIFFADQTFGVHRKRALELCTAMQALKPGFGWVCFSRVDLADPELLSAMQKAGCHTIIFGVESASDEILRYYRKGYTKEQIREAFRVCRQMGIKTVATFIIGLPEETRETCRETVGFLKEIDCDYASFNVAVPKAGTELRKTAIEEGLVANGLTSMDQTGTSIAMPSRHLTGDEITELKSEALRTFYLRPSYLLKRLASVTSWHELTEQIREGIQLFKEH